VTDILVKRFPYWLVSAVASFSVMPHYDSIQRGVVDLRDLAYYASLMAFMLFATHLVLENRKSA
jgi:ABC-2 type transport system permease protein